jgi:hypothetical protein
MCTNLIQDVAHLLTVSLQLFDGLLNCGNEVFLAVTCHLGMHAVALSAAKRVIAKNKDEIFLVQCNT